MNARQGQERGSGREGVGEKRCSLEQGEALCSAGHFLGIFWLKDVPQIVLYLSGETGNREDYRTALAVKVEKKSGVSRLLCKRPGFVFGDGVPGKGAVPLPRHRFRSSPVFIA